MHYSAGFDIRFSLTCSITSSTVLPVFELIWSVLHVNCGDSFPGINRSERFLNFSSATAIMGVLHFLSKQAFFQSVLSAKFCLILAIPALATVKENASTAFFASSYFLLNRWRLWLCLCFRLILWWGMLVLRGFLRFSDMSWMHGLSSPRYAFSFFVL